MTDTPFSSLQDFQQAFVDGLSGLLRKGGLGPFILVCANAGFDRKVQQATAAELGHLYAALRDEYVAALSQGRPIAAVEEDLLVFLKLHAVGYDQLQSTELRQTGPWEIQFNQLRSFRPRRIANQVPASLCVPFDEGGFHFNKPFMQKEAFWEGDLHGRRATLFYNKYPFIDLHGLLVLEREAGHAQFLQQAHHHYLWQLTGALAQALPGVGFGYNALGAFASVNHLHFQMFVKAAGLPVMQAQWRHNGGPSVYPATCLAFEDATAAWEAIARLHADNTPYNLLYTPGRLYLFPRRKQGSYAQPEWTSGFSWHELAGGMITFNRDDYLRLQPDEIERELARLVL